MFTIARLTFQEVLSKKVFYIVLLLSIVFLSVYGIGLNFTVQDISYYGDGGMDEFQKVMVIPQLLSLSFYFSTIIVALMAVFSTVNAVSGEIETGTIQGVIPKPIRRRDFVLGKLLGFIIMIGIYSVFLYLAVILITRVITGFSAEGIFEGLMFFLLIPILLAVLSIFGSTFLSTLANGISVFMLFIIGTVGGMMEQIGALIENKALVNIGVISSLIMPTDAIYRKMIYTVLSASGGAMDIFSANPFASKNPPSDVMVIYILIYILIIVFATVRIFNKRDI